MYQRRYPRNNVDASIKIDPQIFKQFYGRDYKDDEEKSLFSLQVWHLIATVFHIISFIGLVIAYNVVNKEGNKLGAILTSDLLTFNDNTTPPSKDVAVTTVNTGYDLFWVLFPMPLITATAHLVQFFLIIDGRRASSSQIEPNFWEQWGISFIENFKHNMNVIRWLEYSITASLMTFILAQLCGITNIYLAILIGGFCNITLQWHGYYLEILQNLDEKTTWWFNRWSPMIGGFVIFAGQWLILFCYFFRTTIQNEVRAFVYVSFWGVFASFCFFPLLQVLYFNKLIFVKAGDWYWYEWSFIMLSLVSKLFLDWSLFGGILST